MSNADVEVVERLRAKDQLLWGLSDILDAKAGIALVVITFLASQSGELLAGGKLVPLFRGFQLLSIVCLAAAGIAAISSLWPREHDAEGAENLDEWVVQLREFYKDDADPDKAVDDEFRNGMIRRLKERIVKNQEIDADKADLINRSYMLAGVALALNLMTLLSVAFIGPS